SDAAAADLSASSSAAYLIMISRVRQPRIVQVHYSPPRAKPLGLLDPMPVVRATFDDGTRKDLFSFYPDEIRFDEGELIGLTEIEASALRRRNAIEVLR